MGIVAGLGAAAAATSIAGGISGMVNGPGGGAGAGYNVPQAYQLQNLGVADQAYGGTFAPYHSTVQNIQNNPYAQPAQNYAGLITGQAADLNSQFGGYAGNLAGLAPVGAPYASTILNTAFDPQGALYDRTLQRVTDQGAALNAMNGLSGTPYGAGLQMDANRNFNIDWQNQQLGRELQGIQGYGNLVSDVGRAYSGAAGLSSAGLGTEAQYFNLPYSTYFGQQKDTLGALSGDAALGASYLGLNPSFVNAGINSSNAAFGQQQQLGQQVGAGFQGLGQGLSGLSNLFAPSSNTPMMGIQGGYSNVNPSTFDYFANDGAYLSA